MALRDAIGETDGAVISLTGTHHNLLRMWAALRPAFLSNPL